MLVDRRKPNYFRALTGIRGYAFLAVFFTHYDLVLERPASIWHSPMYLWLNLTWFLVPIYFVMSGFLITRILLGTREREGYFRIFYLRRAIRVLPLYYIVIGAVALSALFWHYQLGAKHGLYLMFLQNFTDVRVGKWVDVSHLWSLSIEEQFYLLWPLAIWKLRSERQLLRFTYALIASCTVFRILWPLWHMQAWHAYTTTPARVDAILLGCALALHYNRLNDRAEGFAERWKPYALYAKVSMLVIFAMLLVVMAVQGTTLPQFTYVGIAFCTPAMNLIGLAIVMLAITPGSVVEHACSRKWVCRFGQLTYGLYLLHQVYSPIFFYKVTPMLARHMPQVLAQWCAGFIALALTTGLAWLANRFVEKPMATLKEKYKYGPAVEPAPIRMVPQRVLADGPTEEALGS